MSARIADAVLLEASVYLRALALGDTRGLSQQDWEVLRATGLTHLIAISGFHVGMVAAVPVRCLCRCCGEFSHIWLGVGRGQSLWHSLRYRPQPATPSWLGRHCPQ